MSIADVLSGIGIPYMVIGGMANAVWGEPRATLDIDDVRAILRRRRDSLDRAYLDLRIRELAEGLERPDIWENCQLWLGEAR